MNLSVNEVLTIVGRLDDSPGFDTPRERFRRFLTERVTDQNAARLVLQECRQTLGDQNNRALQDAVVLAGKLLGFLTTFGPYQHRPATAPVNGHWESRRRLRVVLSVCSSQIGAADLDALATFVRTGSGAKSRSDTPRVGLCIVTPSCANRSRLEELFRARTHPELRLISLDTILHLADLVAAGQLTHDLVLQVFYPDTNIDSLMTLLERSTSAAPRVSDGTPDELPTEQPPHDDNGYWLAAVRLPSDTPAAEFVTAVIGKRRLLGVNVVAEQKRGIQPGDAIGVCVTGSGFVADARVEGFVTDGSGAVRDSERFTQVLRLSDVKVYDRPTIAESDLLRTLEQNLNGEAGAIVTPVSRHDFESATRTGAAARTD